MAVERDTAMAKLSTLLDDQYCVGCGQSYKISQGHTCTSCNFVDLHGCAGCGQLYKLSEGHNCGQLLSSSEWKSKTDKLNHDYYYSNPFSTHQPNKASDTTDFDIEAFLAQSH